MNKITGECNVLQISIVVPIYNVEEYLQRCVDSILNQTFRDFELILVDDGSTDNCGKMCDEFAQIDKRIKVIHKENGGLSDARNAGIDWVFDNSDSKWITFIDSDDWVSENYLEILYKSAVGKSANISCCTYMTSTTGNVAFSEIIELPQEYDPETFYCKISKYSYSACYKLFQLHLFKNIRFPYKKLNEDAFTIYKVLFSANKIVFIDTALYVYYMRPGSIMRSSWSEKRLDEIEALSCQIEYYKTNNFKEAYKVAIVEYANVIVEQISQCKGQNDLGVKKLKKVLKKHIKRYRFRGYLPINDYSNIYEIVYPRFMRLYRYILLLINRFKGIKIEKNSNSL